MNAVFITILFLGCSWVGIVAGAPASLFHTKLEALDPILTEIMSTEDIKNTVAKDNPAVAASMGKGLDEYYTSKMKELHDKAFELENPTDEVVKDLFVDLIIDLHEARDAVEEDMKKLSPGTRKMVQELFSAKEAKAKEIEHQLELHNAPPCKRETHKEQGMNGGDVAPLSGSYYDGPRPYAYDYYDAYY